VRSFEDKDIMQIAPGRGMVPEWRHPSPWPQSAMDSQQPPTIPDRQGEEPAYEGKLGETRTEHVHVIMADGSMRSVEVPRVVNVATDPELKELVLERRLHRLEDGRDLKLSFVYHDPEARKFALVIPTALSHLELRERAKLMNGLSEDSEHAVPAYVRACTTVIGIDALEAYLAEPAFTDETGLSELPPGRRERELEARKRLLAEKKRSIANRERSLIAVEESIREREEELRERLRRVESRQAELDVRLSRLEERRRSPRVDEYQRANGLAQPVAENGEWRELSTFSPHRTSAIPQPDPEQVPALDAEETRVSDVYGERQVEDVEVEEVRPASRRLSTPPPLSLPRRTISGTPPPLRPHGRVLPPALKLHSEDVDAWQETHTVVAPLPSQSDVEDSPTASRRIDPHGTKVMVSPEAAALPRPDVDPPVRFLATDDVQMSVVLEGQPWLFVRVFADHEQVLGPGSDLLVQHLEVQGYPVVFLVLVDAYEGEPFVRRAVLDPLRKQDRQVLEALELSYEAQVAIYVGDEYKRTFEIAAFREAVVSAILKRVDETPEQLSITAAEALRRAAEEPPPITDPDLPFGPARQQVASFEVVHGAVERLAEWMSPDKLAEATLTYGVPPHVVDASVKRVLEAALKLGVALPEELLERAVEMKLGPDRAAFVEQQLEAFAGRLGSSRDATQNGLLRENSRKLLAYGDEFGLEVDDSVRQLAQEDAPESEEEPLEAEWQLGQPGKEVEEPEQATEQAEEPEEATRVAEVLDDELVEAAEVTGDELVEAAEVTDDELVEAAEVTDDELVEAVEVTDDELEEVARPSLGPLSRAELLHRLEQPELDRGAAIELCRRRETGTVAAIFKAMEQMADRDVFGVAPYVLLMGESSGDVLIPALGSRSPAVRHASALLLGRLRLRRAIAPLLKQLRQEESALWTEIARALGEFGSSASRRVITALRESKGADQRFVLTLAHLSNHGCLKEIEKLQKDPTPRMASAARMAIAQRSKVQWEDLAIREQGKIADDEPAARLSQLFYSKAFIVQSEL
jgi:hypothetical protein